jgi:lactoylglutathione lyase
MKFCWSTLHIRDMEESLKFYTEIVGLSVERRFKAGPAMEIVFLGNGETKVELVADKQHKNISIGQDISLGFTVDSVDEKILSLQQKGISLHSGPFQPNPHIRFFYLLDPNGLKIQFVEQL